MFRFSTTVVALLFMCGYAADVAKSQSDDDPGYLRQSDMIYGRRSGLALTMESFTPRQTNGSGVIWVVSSGGRSSREQTLLPSFEQRILPLLERGYVVFAVIHASAPRFQVPDFVEDASSAVRYIHDHAAEFGVDSQRLAIAGSSAGGYLALLVAMGGAVERDSIPVRVVGAFFPPTDLLNYGRESQTILDYLSQTYGISDPSFQFFSEDANGIRERITARELLLGKLAELSPIEYVSSNDPPTILIHGSADENVPIQQSQRFLQRLNSSNVPAKLVTREGRAHAYPGWESDSTLLADWFDRYLLDSPADP
jgi:dipeptidyl aminopeptidase/acylaminoacyl peptidase